MIAMRLVDGAVSCVGKIYWKMYQLDIAVQNSSLDQTRKTQMRAFVNNRWKMLHTDLHAAVFCVGPRIQTILATRE